MPQPQKTDNSGIEISLYQGNLATKTECIQANSRLSVAFPKMSPGFFVLLTEFVLKNNFTIKRLEDAVNHVISNFHYKELNIADIIRFDKRCKLYTGREFVAAQINGADSSEFEHRIINGANYFIKKSDLI